jgi:uncharacterized protein (DUF2141 family)
MKGNLLLASVLSLSIVFVSCKKDKDPDAIGVSVQNLRGKIVLNEQYGGVNYADRAGATAILSGQFQTYTSTTDDAGRFQFEQLPAGTYSISVSKNGYSTMQINNFTFSPTNPAFPVDGTYQILPTLTLGKKSTFYFDSTMVSLNFNIDTILFVPPDFIEIDTTSVDVIFTSKLLPITPVPFAQRGYRIYVGNGPNLSTSNFLANYHGVTTDGYITKTWTQQEWSALGINLGDVIYVMVKGDSPNEIFYLAPGGQRVYPNLSDSLGIAGAFLIPFN